MDLHESAARPINYSRDNLHARKSKKETVKKRILMISLLLMILDSIVIY